MKHEAFIVIRNAEGFLVVAPAVGAAAEHADLNEAYRLVAASGGGPGRDAYPGVSHRNLGDLMPFFIKSAVIAVVGAFLLAVAAVSFSYSIHGTAKTAGQKAGRAVLSSFTEGLEGAFKNTTPEREEKIKTALRNAASYLKPYVQELKPLFQ